LAYTDNNAKMAGMGGDAVYLNGCGGGVQSQIGNAVPAPPASDNLDGLLSQLEKALGMTYDSVATLEKRLERVRRPARERDRSKPPDDPACHCGIAQRIVELTRYACEIEGSVDAIGDSLQL
jgi:hypothetical protein